MDGETTIEPDMENRDPNELNNHIKVMFEDVIGEPDGVRSMDCIWLNGFKCFECSKSLCYRIMTTLCGLCIAIVWGCDFAFTTFTHVWCWTPIFRSLWISVSCVQKFFSLFIGCCLSPICEACGMMFSKISIHKS